MAVKTENQIERDFFSFVKGSNLGKALLGGVYRSGMRPNDAKTEDLVIKFLAGCILSSCGSRAVKHSLSSCGPQA